MSLSKRLVTDTYSWSTESGVPRIFNRQVDFAAELYSVLKTPFAHSPLGQSYVQYHAEWTAN